MQAPMNTSAPAPTGTPSARPIRDTLISIYVNHIAHAFSAISASGDLHSMTKIYEAAAAQATHIALDDEHMLYHQRPSASPATEHGVNYGGNSQSMEGIQKAIMSISDRIDTISNSIEKRLSALETKMEDLSAEMVIKASGELHSDDALLAFPDSDDDTHNELDDGVDDDADHHRQSTGYQFDKSKVDLEAMRAAIREGRTVWDPVAQWPAKSKPTRQDQSDEQAQARTVMEAATAEAKNKVHFDDLIEDKDVLKEFMDNVRPSN
jgi:hypothetical protein